VAGKQTSPSRADDPFALARRLKTPVWVYDTDNRCIAFANEPAVTVWQAESEEQLRARDLSEGMSSTVAKRLKQYQYDFHASDAEFNEVWTIYPGGEPQTLNVTYTGFIMPDGRMAMMCEAKGECEEQPEALRSAEALLHTDVKITLYGLDGRPLYMNPAARNSVPSTMKTFKDLFALSADFNRLKLGWESQGECSHVAQVRTAQGSRWFDFNVKRCLDAATGDQALLVTAVDVSELKNARDHARYLAHRDQLTGCYNRSAMQHHLDELRANADAHGQDYALLFLDIDKFKQVNDTFGHEIGDAILIAFATRVQQQLRSADIMARMGGDEFVVLLNDFNDADALKRRLNEVCQHVRAPVDCGSVQLDITTSIGASIFNLTSQIDWSVIMKQADIALYHSKRNGRDGFTLFDESLGAEVDERAWLEAEVIKALAEDAFTLHYQPRFDVRTHAIVAAEALIRWEHPERGYIPPAQFIPICEDMGVIDQIGDMVCRKACAQLNAWHRGGISIDVSVNVSPKQFQSPGITDLFEEVAANAEFPTRHLELEITESSLVGDDTEVARKLRRITELGFRLALDDFGTGYSNLVHISRFPLQCVKLDMSFVQQLPATGPLLRLIFALAKQIGATTVAEGVERPEQLQWLQRHDCDEVQGFLFSKAIPAADLTTMMRLGFTEKSVA